jgi:hypothetical protein
MLISFLNPWSGIHAKGMRTEQDMPSFDLEWLHTTLLGFRIWYGKCSPVSSSSTSPHGLICSFAPTPRCKPFSRGVADGRISLYRGPPNVIQTRVGEHCVEFNSVNIVQTIQDWWGDVQRYKKKIRFRSILSLPMTQMIGVKLWIECPSSSRRHVQRLAWR